MPSYNLCVSGLASISGIFSGLVALCIVASMCIKCIENLDSYVSFISLKLRNFITKYTRKHEVINQTLRAVLINTYEIIYKQCWNWKKKTI